MKDKEKLLILKDNIRQIILKPKNKRFTKDNDLLYQTFKSFPYFQILQEIRQNGLLIYRAVINNLDFKSYEPNESIFLENDPYDSIIIIIEGSITVYKQPNTKEIINQRPLSNYLKKQSKDREINYILKQGERYGDENIKELTKHPCFVDAKTKCIIGVIGKTQFLNITEKKTIVEKININTFLDTIPLFQNLTLLQQDQLHYNIDKEIYNKGEFVLHQGDPITKVYIIRKGLFKISLKNSRTLYNKYDLSFFDKNNEEPTSFCTNRLFELKDSYREAIDYKLFNYGPGTVLGDCEYRNKSPVSYFTIQSDTEKSELCSITLSNCPEYNIPRILGGMNEIVKKKLDNLKKRLTSIRDCQKNLFLHQKSQYERAILRKIPEDSFKEKKAMVKSISCEMKSFKVILPEFKTNIDSYVTKKHIKYNNGLSIDYSEMNLHDNMLTYLVDGSRTRDLTTRFNYKKSFACSPHKININIKKSKHKEIKDILLGNSINQSMIDEPQSSSRCSYRTKDSQTLFQNYKKTPQFALTRKRINRSNSTNQLNNTSYSLQVASFRKRGLT